ncbi:MAG: hypothetical protein ACJ77B_08010 [Chloroflexota bacterium]
MRRFVPIALGLLLLALVLPGAAAAKAPATPGFTTAVTGTTASGDPVAGTLTVTRFAVRHGEVVALGTISDVTVNGVARPGSQAVELPVGTAPAGTAAAAAAAACPILNLVLGPLHLNLLGLVVDLNQVVLNITAVPGAGALLGNLLCAVAGLLDGGGPLGQIANLLNQILAILNGLTL